MQDDGSSMLLILVVIFLYFVPLIVAKARGHPSAGGVAVLNIFLGWTFLGWVFALAWAFSGTGTHETTIHINTAAVARSDGYEDEDAGSLPQATGSGRLRGSSAGTTDRAVAAEFFGNERIPCPHCAELILPAARVCRYCGRDVEIVLTQRLT